MPSAANVKIEKQIASDNALTDNANSSPLRQGITIIEHKIRNLEKRKSKLESYRDLQRSGKDLNQDQKTAVAKYDEVVQTLEFARDLCKQFLSIAVVSEKDEKKKARKEAIARSQAELTKVREVLLVQDALANMGQDVIREDFLNGRNGAATLTQSDLKLLDDLYTGVTPKHEAGDPTAFTQQVQASAEHLLAVVDGKPKEAFGGTYSQIKEVIGKIHESGYLDQAIEPYVEECVAIEGESAPMPPVNQVDPIPVQAIESMTIDTRQPPMAPVVEPLQQQQPQQPPPQMEPVPMQQIGPEQMYYPQAPPPPQPRPISEVIGNGSFYFIQDSELDTPPEQIPSQTFTNQTYVSAPPPPIPMPPHFQQFPNTPQPQPQQPPLQQPQPIIPQQPQQQPPTQQMVPSQTNNGIGEHIPDSHDDLNRQRGHRQQQALPQRVNNNAQQQQQQHHQPFFANNNGYNNRPNRNRNNGPRTNNRHNQ